MAANITDIEPGRGRDGDTGVTITGTGFSGTPGQNTVTVDGQTATITSESTTSIEFTVPSAITEDQWVDVQVTNDDDSTTSTRKWWSKLNETALDTVSLPGQIPGPFEDDVSETATVAEAKDYERAVTLLERVRANFISVSAVPTPTSWQANTETLSADKTLTDSDETIQRFDCGGATRRVKLPAEGSDNPLFVIINSSNNVPETLIIQNDAGFVLSRIPPGKADWFISDGADWAALIGTTEGGHIILKWGGDATDTAGVERLGVNYQTDQVVGTTTQYETVHKFATQPVIISSIAYNLEINNDPGYVIGIRLDGALARIIFIPFTNQFYGLSEIDPPIYVPAATDIEVTTDLNQAPGEMFVAAYCRLLSATHGEPLQWGGDMSTSGHRFPANGSPDDTTSALVVERMHVMSQAGTLDTLSYRTESGDVTTQLNVGKNGGTAHTFTLSGLAGEETGMGVSVAEGDEVDVFYDGGTGPDKTILYGFLAEYGVSFPWAGDLTTPTDRPEFYVSAFSPPAASVNEDKVVVDDFYHFDRVVWEKNNVGTNTLLEIYLNGALHDAWLTSSGAVGTDDIIDLETKPGDYLAFEYDSGSVPNETHVRLCENVN